MILGHSGVRRNKFTDEYAMEGWWLAGMRVSLMEVFGVVSFMSSGEIRARRTSLSAYSISLQYCHYQIWEGQNYF